MMTKEQYLLVKLAEEASEISQAALKAVQFGINSINPYNGKTNLEHIFTEIDDLHGVLAALEHVSIYYREDTIKVLDKMDKVFTYMNLCKELGTVK